MTPLARLLSARIETAGPISVETFMAEALGHPQFGYYRQGAPIGRGGDFITAPEISQIFGELIGLWAVTVWETMGRPEPLRLVELGPGRGVLLADALRAIAQVRPQALAALALHLVEINPDLRLQQSQQLAGAGFTDPPTWHTDVSDIAAGPSIILANEFFDALPIRQFVRSGEAWCERTVGFDATTEQFQWREGAATPLTLPVSLTDCAEGDVVEQCPAADALIDRIARRLQAFGGAALLIDYGYAKPSFGDTLQAVRGHRIVDPLADPGQVDLSHHVDFPSLRQVAEAAGASVYGPVPQGLFLGRLGIDVRARALVAAAPERAQSIEGSVRRLVHPGRMGVLFKAMALADPRMPPLPGFAASPDR